MIYLVVPYVIQLIRKISSPIAGLTVTIYNILILYFISDNFYYLKLLEV